jgi:RND family efflux transporter MFP subunit
MESFIIAKMKRYGWLFLGLSVAAIAIGYRQLPSETWQKMTGWFLRDTAIPVRVVQVKKASIPVIVRGAGTLQVVKEVDVVSVVAGRLSDARSKIGDRVREGQVLATVHSPELLERRKGIEAALNAAKAELREKESQLTAAEKDLERTRQLRKRDLIAGRDLNDAEAEADTARAAQALAQAQLAQQQVALEQTQYLLSLSKLVAPLSGVLTFRSAEPGASIRDSRTVFKVASLDPLKVMIDVSPAEVGFVRAGMAAQVRADAFPTRVWQGRVTAAPVKPEPNQDPLVEIQLSNRDRALTPGMQVEVMLDSPAKRDVLIVPQQAIVEIEGQNFVFAIVNERIQIKDVTKGRRIEQMIEIESGVAEREWIVVSEQGLPKANTKVRPIPGKTL